MGESQDDCQQIKGTLEYSIGCVDRRYQVCFANPIASIIIRCISSAPTRTFTATNDQESEIPSVMISDSPQVGHLPVPLQFGHFPSSELRATFLPVPKHRWQSPDPPQSQQRLSPARLLNGIDTPWKRF
jgi:hypothetical protein